ncbi:thioester reductase domain-containing protein [Streptomyces sp. NPDC046931]|uniref:thioester reductase domain-containing protein n=1 Tax=Streptomyces sp. NPDC046931 TaxID=3154806 RepID=UPI0034048738
MPEAGSGTSRNRSVNRRPDEEVIERRAAGRNQAADLLARFRKAAAGPAAPAGGQAPGGTRPRGADQLATAIAGLAARFLPGGAADVDTDLFDAGLSSVDAVELVALMARELDVRMSLDDVFADARPRRLARRGTEAGDAAETGGVTAPAPAVLPEALPAAAPAGASAAGDEDLEMILSDLALADRLPFSRQAERTEPRTILLTGATGFLGSHLLLDLLRRGDAEVVCLVRADDDEAAERRLGEALASFEQPWSFEVRRRVTVLAADLRRPRLGLSEERWEKLAHEVDSIVNVAAAVDFLRGYPSLRQTNVVGPLHLAELAMAGRPKPVHHISSVAVFNEVGIATMGEDDPVAHVDQLFAGYDKSKWAAEAVLRRAREHGLTVTFLRPGAIGGHTRTGVYNPRDLSTGLIGAISRFRTVPAFRFMNLAPVDWISKVAAAIVFDPKAWGRNYNLTGRAETLTELVKDMKLAGMNVRATGWQEWRDDLLRRQETDPVPELDFLVRILSSPTAVKLFEALMFGPAAGMDRTEEFLARHRLPLPERYGGEAQLKAFERMARDGVARLPSREDPPYLSFRERMKGHVGPVGAEPDTVCRMAFTLSIASMYQVVRHRRVHVRGEVLCERLHPRPLTVLDGEIWVRPDEGIPHRHGSDHPLLRYRLVLQDRDGGRWWLEGWKTARARHDFWKQTRTLDITVGREGEPASFAGVVQVPGKSYVPDQIDGIRVDPRLSSQEQRLAKLTWLSWFFVQVGMGLVEPSMRAAAELLDLRRDAIDRDKDKLRRKFRKLMIEREQIR